ncbi:MAG: hypothetical protein RSD88_07450 [Anaerovoracaceae bacterium]
MITDKVAQALGKSPQTIRVGLQLNKYPFGIAYKREGSGRYTYTFYPPLVKQYVGIDIGPLEEVNANTATTSIGT